MEPSEQVYGVFIVKTHIFLLLQLQEVILNQRPEKHNPHSPFFFVVYAYTIHVYLKKKIQPSIHMIFFQPVVPSIAEISPSRPTHLPN